VTRCESPSAAALKATESVLIAGDNKGDGREELVLGVPHGLEGRGNGLLALAPPIARIGKTVSPSNRFHASDTPLWSTLSAVPTAHFQVRCREFTGMASNCTAGFNSTNALSFTFTP